MNVDQLIAWLNQNGIKLSERVSVEDGETLTFLGARPIPWDGRPQWATLAIKKGQTKVAKREIEGLLRHFAHGELTIPTSAKAATITENLAVQPLHPEPAKAATPARNKAN
jgi:hypothetical protein